MDYYTCWVELFPMRTASSPVIARLFPKRNSHSLGSSRLHPFGPQFVSNLFKELCKTWTVTPELTTAYHPQTNLTERVNRNLKCMISSYNVENHKKRGSVITWISIRPEFCRSWDHGCIPSRATPWGRVPWINYWRVKIFPPMLLDMM